MAILGIDEVGRGPWAGPLVIGACILPKDEEGNYPDWVEPLTDSKKLSKKKREEYAEIILNEAVATGLGWVSSRELDNIGLSKALKLATRRAVEEIKLRHASFAEIVIDGTTNFLEGTSLEKYVTNLKKADLLIKEVSAASIIAKVARDNYMAALAEKYPDYGFDKHVGYGTAAHKAALMRCGPCLEHRMSFAPMACWDLNNHSQKVVTKNNDEVTTKELGDKAETIVANYLESHGHNIVSRNHKTKFYEIDIISTMGDQIFFTEVKYRKDQSRGTPLDMITKDKLKQMTFAAESFLKFSPSLKENFSPLLAAGLVHGPDFVLDDWLVLK
ncbi:ribonuclease HII [Candidatus Saccharibacteria bacterium]|nr:ribonuclease HII [Candidatus Saccharibacteria bacterium]